MCRLGNTLYIKYLLESPELDNLTMIQINFYFSDDENENKVGNAIIKRINLKVPLNELNSKTPSSI